MTVPRSSSNSPGSSPEVTYPGNPGADDRWLGPNLALGLMLLVLHMGLMVGIGSGPSRAFLLAHFGLFLLWQPLWQGADKLVAGRAMLIVLGGAALAWWSSWWLMALWIAVLFSLIGGNVPGMRALRPRLAPVLAAVYLLTVLLVWVVPHITRAFDPQTLLVVFVRYVLPIPLLAVLVVPPGSRNQSPRYPVDLVYSVMLFLLVIVLVLGAMFVQQITQRDYAVSLLQTVIGIAALMLVLSWLWDPRGGFDGVGQLLSRYFLSLGMPFERWMLSLAAIAERETDPETFISRAAEELLTLPWIAGAGWKTDVRSGDRGERSRYSTQFEFGGVDLTLYSRWRPSPGMLVHMRLLARLLGDYYEAKRREQAQRNTAYLQAIYETGSRVTHDVKNLLQSLRSLCSAAAVGSDADPDALLRLIQRQLPQITQRLQTTLDKLDTPRACPSETVPSAEWWSSLVQRYAHEKVEFESTIEGTERLNGELFDSVADNLIQNALEKRRRSPVDRIAVWLERTRDGRCRLTVEDAGEPLSEELVSSLFSVPVSSETGLGVGLFQCHKQAADAGYTLSLDRNETGAVRFVCEPDGAQSAKAATPDGQS